VTCILVRVRPKDVVHSRLYRPFSLKRKKKTRERGTNRRERWRNPEEREREGGERFADMYFLMVWVCRRGWRSKF